MRIITEILAAVFGIYGLVVVLTFSGTRFHLIWFFLALLCLAWGRWGMARYLQLPGWVRLTVLAGVTIGVLSFFFLEGKVLSCFGRKLPAGMDYVIVPGAQVTDRGPSTVLRFRLDAALAYSAENPGTVFIVSGGKGVNERESEALGMQRYLAEGGIAPERILMEDRSSNTVQNMRFSAALIGDENASVGIITNNFHLYRAMALARGAGMKKVYGEAAPSTLLFLPNNILREYFGIIKDVVQGNMQL